MERQFSRQILLAGLAITTLLGPAGTSQAAGAEWQDGAPAEWARVMTAAQTEGEVTVAAFPALEEKMSAAFKRDTGIRLNFLSSNTAEQSARLEAEARAKNLTIDILLGGGRERGPMMRDGLLQPIAPQLLLPGVGPMNFRRGKLKWMDTTSQYLL